MNNKPQRQWNSANPSKHFVSAAFFPENRYFQWRWSEFPKHNLSQGNKHEKFKALYLSLPRFFLKKEFTLSLCRSADYTNIK